MKKIFALFLSGFFIFNPLAAEIYYCSDEIKNGIHSVTGKENDYKPTQIILSKFKAKIDFEEMEFISNDLKLTNLKCIMIPGQKSMSCSSVWGDHISLDATNTNSNIIRYYRAAIYGRGDTLFVANGTCDKF